MEINITFEANKKINANINGFVIKTDQPETVGGEGTAPNPFELFLASLGTCAGIFIKMFCDQRGISSEGIELKLNIDFNGGLASKVIYNIDIPKDFPEKYIDSLKAVVDACKVKKNIFAPPLFEIIAKYK